MAVEPEYYPGTHVFINRLGITEAKSLAEAEASITVVRTEAYRLTLPVATFDLFHLETIHHYLFGDLYDWAGELRGYDMHKDGSTFTPHADIERYAAQVYGDLKAERYLAGLDRAAVVPRLAHYYDLTNRLHPFPEGNGRTQRLFIEHLAAHAGYRVDWTLAKPWQVVEVAVQSFQGNFEPTVLMFEEIMTR